MASNRQIKDQLEENFKLQTEHGLGIVNQMTGGVDSLPDKPEFGPIKLGRAQEIKKMVRDIIPQRVGRIDAVALEF